MAIDRSKLDQVQQDRCSYDSDENARSVIQKNTLVDSAYTRGDITYNACCDATKICYFDERVAEINAVTVNGDSCNSLDGTYFLLNGSKNATNYFIWFCTNCLCNVPTVPCRTAIKVCICTNDFSAVVALATQQQVNASPCFSATVCANFVTITNSSIGIACASADGTAGFTFSHTTSGDNRLTSVVEFEYDCAGNVTRFDRTT